MATKPTENVSDILADPTVVEQAVREAVREAVRRHRLLGLPLAVWKDGQLAWIAPEEALAVETTDPPRETK